MFLSVKKLIHHSLFFGALALMLPIGAISADEPDLTSKSYTICNPCPTNRGPKGCKGEKGCKGDKGSKGERGPRGHAGTDGVNFEFPLDSGQSLTFNFSIDASVDTTTALGVGSAITPFVIRPDAVVVLGTPYPIDSTGTFSLAPITINNPPFGTYNVGVQTFSGSDSTYFVTLVETATASRDNSITYLLNKAELGLNLSFPGAQTQTSANFGYFLPVPSLPVAN